MTTSKLVTKLKETETDYEFYPTTIEIVSALVGYIQAQDGLYKGKVNRVLDIGCGNGNLFQKWDEVAVGIESWERSDYVPHQRFGIEKAQVLINELPENVTLLGTDFWEQSLIDKQMDLIFCNPPYSQYQEWMEKIILEGNAPRIAFVVPDRWEKSDRVKVAMSRRGYEHEVLGQYSFENAERSARANVELVVLSANKKRLSVVDPFDTWFDSTFKIAEKAIQKEDKAMKAEQITQELVQSENLVKQLVDFYNADMEKIYRNYKAIEQLDYKILKELNVDLDSLKQGLKTRIEGLKNLYWNMLFKRYDKITKRLSSFSRQKILDKLYAHAVVDFTEGNIFAITHWIIRNSNTMFDEQLKDFYLKLSNPESIERYKSDKRFNDDDWRYIKQQVNYYGNFSDKTALKNYMLDYRIVYKGCHNFEYHGLSNETFDLISDMIIIAKNLGFTFNDGIFPETNWHTRDKDWSKFDLFYADGNPFVNVKLYQNGNKHLKFDTGFMKKLNIEAARLNGWITSKEEVKKELDLTDSDMLLWGSNKHIGLINTQMLMLE